MTRDKRGGIGTNEETKDKRIDIGTTKDTKGKQKRQQVQQMRHRDRI